MDNQLLQYIITQEHAGYSEQQIRQALNQNGYSQTDIDAAFKQLTPQHDDEVKALVQQYANQGYPPVQIFSTLTQQGYKPGAVRKAVNDVFGPLMLPRSHTTAIFLVVALLIVAGGLYLLLHRSTISVEQNYPVTPVQELSTSERISRILSIADKNGKSDAVNACMQQFFDDERGRCISAVATYPSISDDRLCDQIVQPDIRDACLLNFLNKDFEGVCSRVQLRDSIELCESISKLRQTPAST